jgi:hypothetical protein
MLPWRDAWLRDVYLIKINILLDISETAEYVCSYIACLNIVDQ